MENYFDAVQVQLNALCQARAERRRRTRVRWAALTPSTGVILVSVLITAVVFVVAVSSFSGREHASAPAQTGTVPAPSPAAQRALASLDGLPQSGTRLGDTHAPVVITVFADLECRACQSFALGQAFRGLVARQVRSGQVSVEFRSFCTTTCSGKNGRIFDNQQTAAYAAGRQNRFWDYALVFFAEQRDGSGYATSAYLERLARQVPGLNLEHWQKERSAPALAARLRTDASIARTDEVMATPTLIVAGTNAHVTLIGVPTSRQLAGAIAKAKRPLAQRANAVVKACLATGHLTRRYSRSELRAALRAMSAGVKQYSNCPDIIRRALRSAR